MIGAHPASSPAPVPRTARSVVETLRAQITAGTYRQGMQLPTERALAREFGVARNTVRRALEWLEKAGLVERCVGRGTFARAPFANAPPGLASLSETGPADVLDARLALEPGMAELIILRASEREFAAMSETLRAADRAANWQAFETCDEQFHHQLARATRNLMIVRVADELARVRAHVRWGEIKARTLDPARRAAIQRDHYAILDALKARDAARARQAMRVHVLHVRESMLAALG